MSRMAIAQRERLARLVKAKAAHLPGPSAPPLPYWIARNGNDDIKWTPRVVKWDEWDGRPWNLMDYTLHRNGRYLRWGGKYRRSLIAHEQRLRQSDHVYALDLYMRDHFRYRHDTWCSPLHRSVARLVDEISLVTKLMQTAPLGLIRRFRGPLEELASVSAELSQTCYRFRMQQLSLFGNSLRIKVEVARRRILEDFEQRLVERRLLTKNARLTSKLQTRLSGGRAEVDIYRGLASRYASRKQLSVAVDVVKSGNLYLQRYQQLFDKEPRLWAAEGLHQALKIYMDYLDKKIYRQLDEAIRVAYLGSGYGNRWQELLTRVHSNTKEALDGILDIFLLRDELHWIRYYRMEKYPHMDLESEIQAGRAIQRYMSSAVIGALNDWTLRVQKIQYSPRLTAPGMAYSAEAAILSGYWSVQVKNEREAKQALNEQIRPTIRA